MMEIVIGLIGGTIAALVFAFFCHYASVRRRKIRQRERRYDDDAPVVIEGWHKERKNG